MVQYISKTALVAEIERRIKEHHSGYLVCLKDILSFLDTIEVKEVEEITVSDKHIADVTVKEAIDRKIINSQFALRGSYSGKMLFYSLKKSIRKMPENANDLKLIMTYQERKV